MVDKVQTFLPGDPVCDALFSGERGKRAQNKQFKEGPIEYLEGEWSNDPRTLLFKDQLSRELTKAAPASVDDFGRVTGMGVRSNFYSLRRVNGFPMRPATFPIADNRHLREQKKLVNHFVEPWHRDILRSIVKLTCSNLEPSPLRIKKGSSSMLPFFETKMQPKMEICRHALATAAQSAAWMEKGDYVTPWVKNQCGGAYQTVYRRQSSDAVSYEKGVFSAKARSVADLEFALTGGRSGTYVPSGMAFGDEVGFSVPPGFFRERNRTAHGGPLGMNATLMPIAQAIRNHTYAEYAYTFHHTTRESLQSDLRDGWSFSIAADVTQHDQFWPTFIVDTICDGMADAGVKEWWLTLYKTSKRMPMYVTDVDEGLGNILIGDWRKPDLHPGLTSGTATTDLDGTWLMTWVYLLVQVTHTYPELIPSLKDAGRRDSVIHSYLKGKLPIRLKDKSDDALMGWTDASLVPRAMALQKKMKEGELVSPYMLVGYEDGGAFLGSILLYPESGSFSGVVLIGNVISCHVNQFSPEYGVQSGVKDRSRVKRPYPGLSWETLATTYGTAPFYGESMDIVERVWRDVRGFSYRGMREEMLERDRSRLAAALLAMPDSDFSYDDATPIEKEVINDSDKLNYKWLPSDVRPEVLDMLYQGLSLSETEPYFRSAYNG